jgi:large subunit ribosomal protein L10
MKLDEKKQLVDEMREKISRSKVLIIVDFKGLDVTALSILRKKLRDVGVECKVAKNTLLARAVEQTSASVLRDEFKGPSAAVLSYEDPVAPAKVLIEFAKDNQKLEIKNGVMGGKLLSLNDIKALSDLPSREVLIAKLLSVLVGVPTSFVRVLNGVPQSLLNVLQAIKDQKEAA